MHLNYIYLYNNCVTSSKFGLNKLSQMLEIITASVSLPVLSDKPQTSIYTKDDVQLNVENTLICHVSGFFPPPVRVSWTKNNEALKEDSLSQYRPKDDGTYNIFSSLPFTPVEGDIYSCTANHVALDQPQTKTWGECVLLENHWTNFHYLFFPIVFYK